MRLCTLAAAICALALTACQTSPRASATLADAPSIRSAVEVPVAYRLDAQTAKAPRALESSSLLTADACCKAACCCEPCKLDCWDPSCCRNKYVGFSGSLLPNVGIGIGGGFIVKRAPGVQYAVELQGTYQFLDDEDFADDGNPAAGDWYQIRAGMKIISTPKFRRHLTGRFGAVWLRAEGEPNILQDPGDYWGIYGGIGFETDLTPQISVGPELQVMLVTRDDEFDVETPIPQLNWHLIYWMGAKGDRCLKRVPYGELYVGAAATLSPGIGGAFQFGQVFSRSSLATWSVEVMAGGQEVTEDLWFDESSGDFAQIRGGAKAVFQPCSRGHLTARAGLTWLRSTAMNEFLDSEGDHFGAYVGIGYEFDLGSRFTTGPELTLNGVAEEKTSDVEWIPQLNWHFILKL